MQAFVPRSRRLKFELQLRIVDLNNVPLASGISFIKWHLPHSQRADHRGRTTKCSIKDHKVFYEYARKMQVRMTVDKNGYLQETPIMFEILQEYSAGTRGERITLGHIRLNLAEYVDDSDWESDEGVSRRYLMQDSKINSTLKISIHMRLIEGEKNFIAPALKTAVVFGGIAGIIAGEQGDGDEDGQVPSLGNKKTREIGEAQDMYRRNMAAFWTAQPGELKADECIENIFAGGDGWAGKKHEQVKKPGPGRKRGNNRSTSRQARSIKTDEVEAIPLQTKQDSDESRPSSRHRTEIQDESLSGQGRTSLEQQAQNMKASSFQRHGHGNCEADEFEMREDLISWKISGIRKGTAT